MRKQLAISLVFAQLVAVPAQALDTVSFPLAARTAQEAVGRLDDRIERIINYVACGREANYYIERRNLAQDDDYQAGEALLEIMIGKIVPYIGFGFVQVAVILVAGQILFNVPMMGSLTLLLGATLLFIASNVTLGYTISTVARSQMQAMQMTFFIFLPSILLSEFMFPFRGMPDWAQVLGEVIPLTHFLRVVRGIMLKGANFAEVWPNVWPIVAIWAALATLALLRYRRTLD